MPALFPPCYVFREVGPVIVSGEIRDELLCVSADGVIECINGKDCCYSDETLDHEKKITIEIKCPFNLDNPFYNPLYILPERYVPQVTSQMFVFDSDVSLFVTKARNSVIVKRVAMDTDLWESQSEVLTNFYDTLFLKKPNKFHENRNILKEDIKKFAEVNTQCIMELPLVKCVDTTAHDIDGIGPFKKHNSIIQRTVNIEEFKVNVQNVLTNTLCVIKDAQNICRHKASEILIFMLSDSDRMKLQNDECYTHAIGYAMKGNSLNLKTMRDMINLLRNTLQEKNIPILCECFDGQWANLAFKDENGLPLTLLHLLNSSWEKSKTMSRKNVIWNLKEIAQIKTDDLVKVSADFTGGLHKSVSGNLTATIQFHANGKSFYSVETTRINSDSSRYVRVSVKKVKKNVKNDVNHDSLQNKKKETGILPDDVDFVSMLQPDLLFDIYHDNAGDNTEMQLEDFLFSPRLQLIKEILNKLQTIGKAPEWVEYTEEDLFPHILTDKKTLLMFSRYDIDLIIGVIEKYTWRKIFASKDTKDVRAAKISFLFGSGKLLYNKPKVVPHLKNLAQNIVETFPLTVLQSIYASVIHVENTNNWNLRATVTMTAYVPIVKDKIPLFYFPERSTARQQIEFRTLDYTHQLTNLRSIVCRKGIENVRRSEFARICNEFPSILSKAIVEGECDKQCASMAIKLFSEDVERKLTENNAVHEALFVKLVRNWYKACDQRGMSADDRVNNLWAFYAYLSKDIAFDMFPAYTQYVKGIPFITYCGIMQNISARLSLYSKAKCSTYNHRSISSLVCESFFSTVSSKDPGKTGCPRSVDIPKMMSDMIILEEYKQDCLRLVVMRNFATKFRTSELFINRYLH